MGQKKTERFSVNHKEQNLRTKETEFRNTEFGHFCVLVSFVSVLDLGLCDFNPLLRHLFITYICELFDSYRSSEKFGQMLRFCDSKLYSAEALQYIYLP